MKNKIKKVKLLAEKAYRNLPEIDRNRCDTKLSNRLMGVISACEYFLGRVETVNGCGFDFANEVETIGTGSDD